MLEAVARLLIWLCLGEALMRLGLVPVPSPVTGRRGRRGGRDG